MVIRPSRCVRVAEIEENKFGSTRMGTFLGAPSQLFVLVMTTISNNQFYMSLSARETGSPSSISFLVSLSQRVR